MATVSCHLLLTRLCGSWRAEERQQDLERVQVLVQDLVQGRVTPGQLVILNSEDLTADPDCTHSRHESFRRESKGRQHHLHPRLSARGHSSADGPSHLCRGLITPGPVARSAGGADRDDRVTSGARRV